MPNTASNNTVLLPTTLHHPHPVSRQLTLNCRSTACCPHLPSKRMLPNTPTPLPPTWPSEIPFTNALLVTPALLEFATRPSLFGPRQQYPSARATNTPILPCFRTPYPPRRPSLFGLPGPFSNHTPALLPTSIQGHPRFTQGHLTRTEIPPIPPEQPSLFGLPGALLFHLPHLAPACAKSS